MRIVAIKTIKTRVALDGEAAFKQSLQSINSNLTVMKSQMAEVTASYGKNSNSAKSLKSQNKLLADQIEQQKEKVKLLSDQYARSETTYKNAIENQKKMVQQYGAESQEAKKAADAVRDAERSCDRYRTQLNNATTTMHNMSNQTAENSEKIRQLNKEKLQHITDQIKKMGSACTDVAKVGIKAVTAELSGAVKGLEVYAGAVGAAATAVGGLAMKSGQDFEKSMSNVEALSGASGDSLKALSDKAKEMGASTSKSAAESADALGYMALAGWNNEQMLTGLEPILRASEAGNMELASCSDLVTDSMSAMGIGVEDLNHYLDVCTKTQSSANTSMQGLLEAYVSCGGTMKNMNVPLETSATMLGALANRGIKGSEAGTALNSIMVNLMGNTKRTAEAMSALGVSMYENGERREINDVLMDLNVALANCSEESRDTFTAFLGGKTQMDTLQALLAGMSEEYGDLNAQINDCDGCLLETAKTMQDNVPGAITAMKSATEGLGISIYETFSNQLKKNIGNVTEVISEISKAISSGGSVVGAIKKLTPQISKAVKENLRSVAKGLKENLSIFNEVILSIVQIINEALPITMVLILPKFIKGLTDLVVSLVEFLPSLTGNFVNGAVTLFSGLIDGLRQASDALIAVLPEVIGLLCNQATSTGCANMILAGFDILMALLDGIVASLDVILEVGTQTLLKIIEGIAQRLPDLITTAVDIIFTLCDALLDNLPEIINAAIQILLALINGIIDNLDRIFEYIPQVITAVVQAIIENLNPLTQAAIEILIAIGSALVSCVSELISFIPQVISAIFEAFKGTDWKEIGINIMMGVIEGITEIGDKAMNLLSGAVEKIKGVFTGKFEIHSPSRLMKRDVGANLALGITEGFSETMDKASMDMINAMPDLRTSINADYSVASPGMNVESANPVSVYVTFENAQFHDLGSDIENIAVELSSLTRAALAGKGA